MREFLPAANEVWPKVMFLPRANTPCAVDAGIRLTSGRYASHWNAFLFWFFKKKGLGIPVILMDFAQSQIILTGRRCNCVTKLKIEFKQEWIPVGDPSGQKSLWTETPGRNIGPETETPWKKHGTRQPDRKWHHIESPPLNNGQNAKHVNMIVVYNCLLHPIITAHKWSLRRLCFHRCLSVHEGVSAPLHAGIHSPWIDIPLADTPLGRPPHQYHSIPIIFFKTICSLDLLITTDDCTALFIR